MFLIQTIYYEANTTLIGMAMPMANAIVGALDTNVVTSIRFTNVIGVLALTTPTLGLSNPSCNDPVVKVVKDGLTNIVEVLTALGVAVAVVGIIVGGLMRATAWGSEQRIAMSNKAISSSVIGLVVVLLGVILGTAVPTWFNMQNNTCPLSPPALSGPGSSATPGSSSTSGTEQNPTPPSSQQPSNQSNHQTVPTPTPKPVRVVPPAPVKPQTTLTSIFQEFNQETNLTSEGTLDWKQWGLNQATDVNHKAGVTPQISDVILVGNGKVGDDQTNPINFTWSDGTPSQVNGGTGAIYISGLTDGFSITVPATTTLRTLRLYVGANQAEGLFTASLNGVAREDATLDMTHNPTRTSDNGVYTISYSSSVPNQRLTITFTELAANASAGYILLEAATLQ